MILMYSSIIKKLDSQIINNKINHAYLFEVNNYLNDFDIIISFVKMILSNMVYSDVVNNNDIDYFRQIDNNQYVDLFIIEPDGNDIKKNQMINLMNEFSNKSLINNKKIYIIKECEKFNSSSANTILKFLEEPNDDIIGILLTTNRYKVLDTILSRCQIFSFIDDFNYEFNEDYIDLVDFVLSIKKNIINYDDIFNKYFVDKNVSKNTINILEDLFINFINENIDLDILKQYDSNIYSNLILLLDSEKNKLNYNVNIKIWFDCFIVNILEVLG